jgi:hypothetical protein
MTPVGVVWEGDGGVILIMRRRGGVGQVNRVSIGRVVGPRDVGDSVAVCVLVLRLSWEFRLGRERLVVGSWVFVYL